MNKSETVGGQFYGEDKNCKGADCILIMSHGIKQNKMVILVRNTFNPFSQTKIKVF